MDGIIYNLRGLIAEKLLGLALSIYHPKDPRKDSLAEWIIYESQIPRDYMRNK